jgi:hypothetical protein
MECRGGQQNSARIGCDRADCCYRSPSYAGKSFPSRVSDSPYKRAFSGFDYPQNARRKQRPVQIMRVSCRVATAPKLECSIGQGAESAAPPASHKTAGDSMGRPRSHRRARRESARVLRLSPRASVRSDLDLALNARSVWHCTNRTPSVLRLVRQTKGIRWTPGLLEILLDELFVTDDFVALLGNPTELPVDRYPQAVAVAMALRHSWRQDDFRRFTRRLRVRWSSK